MEPMTTTTKRTVTREELLDLCDSVLNHCEADTMTGELSNMAGVLIAKAATIASDKGLEYNTTYKNGTWEYTLDKLGKWLLALSKFEKQALQATPFTIFTKGNSKLPFYNFSTLPLVTCSGFGECGNWCYSLKAWRYPNAYARQLMNTILLQIETDYCGSYDYTPITDAFNSLPSGSTFRLYVDGDFANTHQISYWFHRLNQRPDIIAYGYTKSWADVLEWFTMAGVNDWDVPTNYVLNLSNGSRYDDDDDMREAMEQLPITRGEFVAVPVHGNYAAGFAKADDKAYHAEVREVARKLYPDRPVFSCPLQCGTCTAGTAACADGVRFDNVVVAIGLH